MIYIIKSCPFGSLLEITGFFVMISKALYPFIQKELKFNSSHVDNEGAGTSRYSEGSLFRTEHRFRYSECSIFRIYQQVRYSELSIRFVIPMAWV